MKTHESEVQRFRSGFRSVSDTCSGPVSGPGTLHSFVLQRCDVFEARRRHVPVSACPLLPGSPRRAAACRDEATG